MRAAPWPEGLPQMLSPPLHLSWCKYPRTVVERWLTMQVPISFKTIDQLLADARTQHEENFNLRAFRHRQQRYSSRVQARVREERVAPENLSWAPLRVGNRIADQLSQLVELKIPCFTVLVSSANTAKSEIQKSNGFSNSSHGQKNTEMIFDGNAVWKFTRNYKLTG